MEAKIEEILEHIRPALALHGGDIELIRFEKKTDTVFVSFVGTCTHCSIAEITLKHLVEREIRSALPKIREVVLQPL